MGRSSETDGVRDLRSKSQNGKFPVTSIVSTAYYWQGNARMGPLPMPSHSAPRLTYRTNGRGAGRTESHHLFTHTHTHTHRQASDRTHTQAHGHV